MTAVLDRIRPLHRLTNAHCFATLLVVFALVLGSGKTYAADFALRQKFALGGEGGWDYLTYDEGSNRLFISRGTHVQVVDPDKGVIVADIPDTPGVHGIALANELGKGFISNGRDNSVTVFDLRSLKTIVKIGTEGGENPDFIAYDSFSKRIFAFNGKSHSASVFDAVALKLIATIPLEGKPEAAVVDGKGMLFVDIEDRNKIAVIDTRRAAVLTSWPVAGCEEPAALAIDIEKRRLFVGCQNRVLAVVDADSGKSVAALPIGAGVDAVAFERATKMIFSSQGDGTMTVIGEVAGDKYSVLQDVATQTGARTLALNPVSHDVYLVSAEFNEAAPVERQQRPRRIMKPGTFSLLVVGLPK